MGTISASPEIRSSKSSEAYLTFAKANRSPFFDCNMSRPFAHEIFNGSLRSRSSNTRVSPVTLYLPVDLTVPPPGGLIGSIVNACSKVPSWLKVHSNLAGPHSVSFHFPFSAGHLHVPTISVARNGVLLRSTGFPVLFSILAPQPTSIAIIAVSNKRSRSADPWNCCTSLLQLAALCSGVTCRRSRRIGRLVMSRLTIRGLRVTGADYVAVPEYNARITFPAFNRTGRFNRSRTSVSGGMPSAW